MALKELSKLADRIEKLLKTAVEVDTVESYPGENLPSGRLITVRTKLRNAKRQANQDLNSIGNNYYMHESQLKQAQYEMNHQLFLLKYTKQVQVLIDKYLDSDNPDMTKMSNEVGHILEESKALYPANKNRGPHTNPPSKPIQPLSEVTSLRLLRAAIDDDMLKNFKPIPPPDFGEMSRKNKEDFAKWDAEQMELEKGIQERVRAREIEQSQEPTKSIQMPSSPTLKSRQEGELDDTQPAPKK